MRIPMPHVRKRARIEIIPLIDIIFFLLATFVMVSMSMVKLQGIKVNLPVVATSADQKESVSVTVTVTQEGTYFYNQQVLSLNQVLINLIKLNELKPEAQVIINGDQKASFADAIGLLDAIRQLGIEKVTIQTKSLAKRN